MSREIIFESQTLSGFALNSELGFYTYEINPAPFSVTADQVYTVSWDETDHICYSFESNGSIVLGNSSPFGLCDTHEPFTIQYTPSDAGGSIALYSTQEAESHDVCVYAGVADDVEGIVLYNIDGLKRIHHGIDTLTVDTTTPDKVQTFTKGVVADPGEINIELNFQNGDHEYEAPDGILIKTATIKKPENLKPENIPEGLYIAGVGPGEFKGGNFENVALDELFNRTITEAICPETLNIPNGIFNGCSKLSIATFPKCSSIGSAAFGYCSNLTDISFPECEFIGSNAFAGTGIAWSSTGAYGAGISVADFPKCSIIHSSAFYNCWKLSSINFPLCKTVGSSAFGCYNSNYWGAAPKFSIASFPAATTISAYAFAYVSKLQVASFPECTNIGSRAFQQCSNLETAYFPKATYVGSYAFYACLHMKSVNFQAATGVGSYAFWNINGWESLPSTVFPALKTIQSYAFQYNYYLSYVYLPAVTTVGSYAFSGCTRLETLSLPACTNLYTNALVSCNKLMSLYLLGSSYVTLANSSVFNSTPMKDSSYTGAFGSIFVRSSMLLSYWTRTYWSAVSARLVGLTDEEITALDAAQGGST